MQLLRTDSSARRNSVSRQLTSRFVETWKKEKPKGGVIERDLATTHLPLIRTSGRSPFIRTPPVNSTQGEQNGSQ